MDGQHTAFALLVTSNYTSCVHHTVESSSHGSSNHQEQIMIGIVTALPKEYAAMDETLDNPQDLNLAGSSACRRYRRGFVPGSGGGQHTVLLALGDMGNNAAAIRASLMLQHFPDLKHIIMVGIAGGVPNPAKVEDHVRLGDVVVSGQGGVVQYD